MMIKCRKIYEKELICIQKILITEVITKKHPLQQREKMQIFVKI